MDNGPSPDLGWPNYQQSTVERWQHGQHTTLQDYIAEEVPVVLVYNGTPHVVMLATPTNLEEFALGFSITEGILHSAKDMLSCRVFTRAKGIEVSMKISAASASCMIDKGRNLTGRTGCGLCGATSLEQATRIPAPVTSALVLSSQQLLAALAQLQQQQKINQLTGSVHAAAWAVPGQGILAVREDVGRHNALDKLIGWILKTGQDVAAGFIIVTSRASYEMVQKTATVGVGVLVAVSAPTGLAIRVAEQANLTLVGFARGDQHVVYTHPYRLTHSNYLS
jgi:FdhD protein